MGSSFTLLCRSLGWDARYVVDELDHVWTEVCNFRLIIHITCFVLGLFYYAKKVGTL